MKRGVMRVADLRDRSRPHGTCWLWAGAACCGSPRIFTFDYDRGEKRTMSGPRAVWSISQRSALGSRLAFMRCCVSSCVNPDHVGSAASKAEIGAHHAAAGVRKGTNVEQRRAAIRVAWERTGCQPTAPAIVLAIRAAGPGPSNMALAREHGIGHTTVSRIRRGESHRALLP